MLYIYVHGSLFHVATYFLFGRLEPKVPVGLLRVQSSFNDGNQTEPPRASKKCMFSASVGAVLSATLCRLVVLRYYAFTRAIEPPFFQALRDECKRMNLTVRKCLQPLYSMI